MGVAGVETVTVLITDLVGSTGLESRIGPGAADELRDEHFALLRGAVQESGGREVKNTGDGLMAAFDSASEAVSCAVALQQRFERRNRSAEEQLLIKVGISLGDATTSDGDYFGIPVIEAARLCDRAQGGQILAKEIVAHLAGGRQRNSFKSVGDLELKGLPEALSTVEVGWEPLGDEGPYLPLPPRLQEMPPGGFVGRAPERARLSGLFTEASEGHRRLVLISGEPGIGKTRLSTHTAFEARSGGAVVLYGRCDEELAIPYGPWIEALYHYIEHAPEAVLRAHAERHGGELMRLVPQLAERLRDLPPLRETDADTERYLLWGAVVGLLREASGQEPLVLVLDDLHWADKPTLLLLKHAVSQGQGVRVLIIATYRESDLARSHPLSDALADLHGEQGVERIALKGLDEANIVEIMERAAGHELDEAGRGLAKELLRESDGNPFYTAELLRHLLESGGVYRQEGGAWTVRGPLSELGLPESVREVVGRRVERLGEETRKALSIAAVIGRDFDVDLLLRVSDHSEEELLGLLEEAVAASVLIESASVPGRFSFAHALINHTLYEDLGTTRRARLHRRIAEALEELLGVEPGARVSELAHHWATATTAVDLPKAISYARMAGERALKELAPDEALRWFHQALELQNQEAAADSPERRELLIGLGEAQRQTGEPAYRETLLEATVLAAGAGDVDRQARAVLATWRGMSALGQRDEDLVTALEAAAQALPKDDPRRAEVLAELAAELTFSAPLEHRRALADEALSVARHAGDPRLLCQVLLQRAYAIWVAHTIEERVTNLQEAVELADRVDDPALKFFAASRSCNVIEAGDLHGFDVHVARMSELLEVLEQPIMRWTLRFTQTPRAVLAGRLEEADALAMEAFQASGGSADGLTIFGAQIMSVRWEQGRLHELLDLLAQAVADNPAISAFKAGYALGLCSTGNHEQARELLESASVDGFASVPLDLAWGTELVIWSDVVFRVGANEAARALYDLLLPHARTITWNGSSVWGPTARHLGRLALMLERYDEAEAHLAAASAEHERIGAPVWQADTDRLLGLTLLRRPLRDVERGRKLLSRAAHAARQHGATGIERETEVALAEVAQR